MSRINVETRRCRVCYETKELKTGFYKNTGAKYYRHTCRKCMYQNRTFTWNDFYKRWKEIKW